VITQDDILTETELSKKKAAKNGSSFELGTMIDRGCFNYRWPVNEYYLDLHENQEAIETAKRKKIEAEQRKHALTPALDEILEGQESDSDSDSDSDEGGENRADENEGSGMQQQKENTNSAEGGTGTNAGAGTTPQAQNVSSRQQAPNMPPGHGTRANEGIGTTQQEQSTPSGQTGTGLNVPTDTAQQEHSTLSGGNSTEEKAEEKDKQKEAERCKHVGTCQMFSCAKGEMFYQVLRIEELRDDGEFNMSFPADSQIVLTMGGPVCKLYP
jgi:hypothetical protein